MRARSLLAGGARRYDPGGFVTVLSSNATQWRAAIAALKTRRWTDEGTRAVSLSLSLSFSLSLSLSLSLSFSAPSHAALRTLRPQALLESQAKDSKASKEQEMQRLRVAKAAAEQEMEKLKDSKESKEQEMQRLRDAQAKELAALRADLAAARKHSEAGLSELTAARDKAQAAAAAAEKELGELRAQLAKTEVPLTPKIPKRLVVCVNPLPSSC